MSNASAAITKGLNETVGQIPNAIANPKKVLGSGVGKGTFGHWIDQIYGGTLKDILSPGHDDDDDAPAAVAAPDMKGGQSDSSANLRAHQNIRKKNEGRLAHNLNKSSGASLLTGK